RQADAAGHSLSHELALLTTHGCLHLLGYDHGTPAEEQEMFALQNELLADWYDSLAKRGLTFHPKPSGAKAFPSAADRETLDEQIVTDFEYPARPWTFARMLSRCGFCVEWWRE